MKSWEVSLYQASPEAALTQFVMAALEAAIQSFRHSAQTDRLDGRVKPGHDEWRSGALGNKGYR